MNNVIEVPWALEIISEKFDTVLELMGPGTIIYGGALRDALAGIEITGDLDIVAAGQPHDTLRSAFSKSARWKRMGKTTNNYKGERLPIAGVSNYINMYDAKVQLIKAKSTGNHEASAYRVVQAVDLRCCGLALTHTGEVIEVVEGAYQDCQDRVLNLACEVKTLLELQKLKQRIVKFEARGWKSEVNLPAVAKAVKFAEKNAHRGRPLLKKSKMAKKSPLSKAKGSGGDITIDLDVSSTATSRGYTNKTSTITKYYTR